MFPLLRTAKLPSTLRVSLFNSITSISHTGTAHSKTTIPFPESDI